MKQCVKERGVLMRTKTHPLLCFRLKTPVSQIQQPWLLLPCSCQRSQQILSMLLVVVLESVQTWRVPVDILKCLCRLLLLYAA